MGRIIQAMVAVLLLCVTPAGIAGERENLAAVFAFNGEGRLFQVGADKLEWLGALSGIMYIETSEGEMDEIAGLVTEFLRRIVEPVSAMPAGRRR